MRKIILLLSVLPVVAFADVPFTFEAGTPAVASEVNGNFADIDARINASLGTLIISSVVASDGSGATGAECPADRIAISVQCHCDNEQGARNFGVLFACQAIGNGGVAGCFPESGTFDPSLPTPLAAVAVGCISATTVDGTPIDPTPIFPKLSKSLSKNGDGTSNSEALADSEEFETALKLARENAADYLIKLLN